MNGSTAATSDAAARLRRACAFALGGTAVLLGGSRIAAGADRSAFPDLAVFAATAVLLAWGAWSGRDALQRTTAILVGIGNAALFWSGLLGVVGRADGRAHLALGMASIALAGPALIRRAWAWAIGAGFVVVGVLRFVPLSVPDLATPQPFHGIVHLVTGGLFVAAATCPDAALRRYERWLGSFYIAFFGLGLAGVATYGDRFVHLGVGLVSVALGITGTAREPAAAPRNRVLDVALWIAQALLAIAFAMAGLRHAVPSLAARMPWTADMPAGIVRSIGVTELLGAFGVVLPAATRIAPRLTPLAAAGLATIMGLASLFHLGRHELRGLPLLGMLAGLACFVAWGRSTAAPIRPRRAPDPGHSQT